MRKFLFSLVLCTVGLTWSVNAQSFTDVIHMKNGSRIRGTIIEHLPDQSATIRTADGSIFVYKIDEIEKFTRETSPDSYDVLRNEPLRRFKFNKPKGYLGLVEAGFGFFPGYVSFSMVNGYRFLPEFAMGVGIGMEMSAFADVGLIMLPLFLHLRTDLPGNMVNPFISMNVGATIPYFATILEPAFGIGFNAGRKNRMTAGVSCMIYGFGGFFEDALCIFKLKLGYSF